MEFTFYQQVKVISGCGSIAKLGEACAESGYKKAFLVFDEGIKAAGIVAKAEESLTAAGVEFYEYDKVLPDPPSQIIDEGAAVCKAEGCDCVVGIGGGSSLDAAKGINILRFNEGSILDYATKPMEVCHDLITIPTTSGTGSELSNGAIVSDTEHDLKLPVLCANCMSEYAILDPELTVGMGKNSTMFTGLDTFSHAAEAYTSVLSNMMTDPVCEKVMEMVVQNLPTAIEDGGNIEARTKMQAAASIGGWMLYNCVAHVGHSVAHVIGGNLHIVHGAACSYGLPYVLEAIAPAVPAKVQKIGEILGVEFDGTESPEQIGTKAADAYRAFRDACGLMPVEDWNVTVDDLPKLVDEVVNEPFAGVTPIQVTPEVAEMLLRGALNL